VSENPPQSPDPAPAVDDATPDAPGGDAPIEVRHRRAPRYGRFITTGLILGGFTSFVIAILTRGWSALAASDTFWLLLMVLGVVGMIAGAALAYLLDRRSLAAIDRQGPEARP